MAIRINDNSSNFVGKVSPTVDDFTSSLVGTFTSDNTAVIDGNINRALGKFRASFKDGSEHPKSKNGFCHVQKNSVSKIHDNTDPLYLVARCADLIQAQELGWFNASGRSNTLPLFQDIIESNPYIWIAVHDAPMHNNVMFRPTSSNKYYFRYQYTYQNRGDAIVYIDHDNLDEIPVNRETSTTSTSKQTGYQLNIANEGVAQRMANLVADYTCGSNYSGENLGGLDLSANVGWMFDGSNYINPKSGAQLLRTQAKGTIVSIVSSNSQQPIEVELDSQPNLPTTGAPLTQDASYGVVTNVDSIVMQPVSQNTDGVLGLHIIGYKNTTGGKSQVYCKLLSSLANSTQVYTPGAGDLWNITNRNSGTTTVDWDANGVAEDEYTDGHNNWTAGMINYWNKLDDNRIAYSGNNMQRILNTISGSFITKFTNGLPTEFGYKGAFDSPNGESIQGQFRFSPLSITDDHDYSLSGHDLERGMQMLAWAKQLVRPSPGGTVNARVRGPTMEVMLWGDGSYTTINQLDAVFAGFFWALFQVVGDITFMTSQWDASARPVLLEECFVDIDTNFTDPAPVFTYDDAGGAIGSAGYPTGSMTWATPDFGSRGYIRRRGDWLIAINLTDLPGDYGTIYNPDQGSLTGYTPRNPEDTITPADFTALETAGIISSGDVLTEYDPANYINQRVTDAFIEANPSKWTGFSFGPRQAHPDDANNAGGTYTLANNPAIARNDANDGSVVDRTSNYALGPLEARLWKIN